MDDERLKAGHHPTDKYFDEQLERIGGPCQRAQVLSEDHQATQATATTTTVLPPPQETLLCHGAEQRCTSCVHGHTAAELIMERATLRRDHMGLTTWQDAGRQKIGKIPTFHLAKNYLTEEELGQLNSWVTLSVDFAESIAPAPHPADHAGLGNSA